MSDVELLELAAKAAGLRHIQYTNDYDGRMGLMQCDEHGRHTYAWNPLLDDGDAFRLAVKLSLLVMPYPLDNGVRVTRLDQPDTIVSYGSPPNPFAATRRAIVRAAAEVAKQEILG